MTFRNITRRFLTVSSVLRLANSALLLLALRTQPFDFYVLLRFATCFTGSYLIYVAIVAKKYGWIVFCAFVILLFNPISQFKIRRETWETINVALGVLWLVSLFFLQEHRAGFEENQQKPVGDQNASASTTANDAAILLRCSSRQHTLRLDSKRLWKTTHCPICKKVVDPLRLRRLAKMPSLLFITGKKPFPSTLRTIVPFLGVLALVVGTSVTVMNWHKVPNTEPERSTTASNMASNASTPNLSTEVPLAEPAPSTASRRSTNTSNGVNTFQELSRETNQIPENELPGENLVEKDLPTVTPSPYLVRYDSGTDLIRPQNVGGRGSLQISNGTNSDAIAKLVDSNTNKTCRLIYVKASTVATIKSIKSGNYILKFSLGTDYDKANSRFLSSQAFSKFDDILDFSETRVRNEIRWNDHDVTLNPVIGGNARTSKISADDFEDQ
ncbi:MAG TPA: DUF6804 family protein [Pyrinomonadaceae bacterium]|nr:DUF6804 family protein [Pyrinomonadaceae bacterium]